MGENMSWLKAIAGGVIGAEALDLIKSYSEKEGGLDAIVKRFRDSGFARQVGSSIDGPKGQGACHRFDAPDNGKLPSARKTCDALGENP